MALDWQLFTCLTASCNSSRLSLGPRRQVRAHSRAVLLRGVNHSAWRPARLLSWRRTDMTQRRRSDTSAWPRLKRCGLRSAASIDLSISATMYPRLEQSSSSCGGHKQSGIQALEPAVRAKDAGFAAAVAEVCEPKHAGSDCTDPKRPATRQTAAMHRRSSRAARLAQETMRRQCRQRQGD